MLKLCVGLRVASSSVAGLASVGLDLCEPQRGLRWGELQRGLWWAWACVSCRGGFGGLGPV